ncbi:MAG: RNA-binding S4 domain-containing protein [Bacteroidales bacterium]|nr:RNA-binding S4 domain-containing protein [Bacteroidales bacterium]
MKEITFTLRKGEDDYIQLIQLLKTTNCVTSGAEAQMVVSEGLVKRNGTTELRKRAKCVPGDIIEYDGIRIELK